MTSAIAMVAELKRILLLCLRIVQQQQPMVEIWQAHVHYGAQLELKTKILVNRLLRW